MKTPTKVKGLSYDRDSLYPNEKELSSSQVLGYWQNPSEFFMEYELGVRRAESSPMHIGKAFSAAYTDRKWNWRKYLQGFDNGKGIRPFRIYESFEIALNAFPVLKKRECEYALRCKYRGWKFRATLDGYYEKRVDIENKTGQVPWFKNREAKLEAGDTTDERYVNFVDESMQITFQYWVKWKKDKCLFDSCQLNWVDFRANATQLVHTFNTERTLLQLQEFQDTVIDPVIDGIEMECWE